MERTTWQQAHDLIERESNILVVLPTNPSTDAIASSLALFTVLEKQGKRVKVVADNFQLPPNHQFLPKSKEIKDNLASLQKFIISLNVGHTQAQELSYDISGDRLNIFVTPKNGYFLPKDVTTSPGEYEYSLIVTLDAPTLESLGPLFEENAEFFYHTPILNIDHRASNGNYGQVNLIELTATSTSEILFELLQQNPNFPLDEYIATNLLAGIISKTKSFQTAAVTPKSLSVASHLIASGARRDDIIRHLYQTKSIDMLRLWGRALARLQTAFQGRYVWSRLNRKDFERSGSTPDHLASVIDELIINTPKAEVVILLYEDTDARIRSVAYTPPSLNGLSLFRDLHPEGSKDLTTLLLPTTTLDEAEEHLLQLLERHYATSR